MRAPRRTIQLRHRQRRAGHVHGLQADVLCKVVQLRHDRVVHVLHQCMSLRFGLRGTCTDTRHVGKPSVPRPTLGVTFDGSLISRSGKQSSGVFNPLQDLFQRLPAFAGVRWVWLYI